MPDYKIRLTDGEEVDVQRIEALSQTTLIVTVSLGKWGNTRKVDSDTDAIQTDASRDMVKFSKKLIISDEYEKIASFDSAFRKDIKKYALKTSFGAGNLIVPVHAFEIVKSKIEQAKIDRQALVDAFLDVYEKHVLESAGLLLSLHDSEDYDGLEDVADAFYIKYRVSSFSAPDSLKAISQKTFDEERARIQVSMHELIEENRVLLRMGVRDVLDKVIDSLSVKPNGKKNALKESTYTNLVEAINSFQMLNIANDREMNSVIEQLKSVTGMTDTKSLRENAGFATAVRSQFDKIKGSIDNLLIADTGTKRKITITED